MAGLRQLVLRHHCELVGIRCLKVGEEIVRLTAADPADLDVVTADVVGTVLQLQRAGQLAPVRLGGVGGGGRVIG